MWRFRRVKVILQVITVCKITRSFTIEGGKAKYKTIAVFRYVFYET